VNINVLKNNEIINKYDLSKEVQGLAGQSLTFFIGRAKHCQIHIDDMQISREHAQLIFKNNEWYVKKVSEFADLKLNSSDVNESKLSNGDMIGIGSYLLMVQLPVINVEPVQTLEAKPSSDIISEKIDFKEATVNETATIDAEIKEETSTATETAPQEGLEGNVNLGEGFEEGAQTASVQEAAQLADLPMDLQVDGQSEGAVVPADDGDSTRVVQSFAKIELELFGEHAPYDKFTVEAQESFIGRDKEKCQIVLADSEVSSVHAVIRKTKIGLTLEDLQSGNGTILNGSRINKAELTNNDEFIIGSTTFTVKITSDFMSKEEDRLMPVETNQVVEVEEVVEEVVEQSVDDLVGGANAADQEKSPLKRMWKDPKKRKMLIIGGVLLAVLMLVPDEEQPADNKDKAKSAKGSGLGSGSGLGAKTKKRSPEEEQFLSATYQLGQELFNTGKYPEAITELEKVKRVDPDYKSVKELIELASEGLRKIEELEKKRQADIEKAERQKRVKELVEKAKEATKERNVTVAEALYANISELDPENFDVPQLKMELDAWKKEQERIKVEAAQKEAERNRKVGLIQPSKAYYLKKDWYRAILKLEEFLKIKDMDEDLIQEGTKMLEESKDSLKQLVDPLLGKARSMKEGQDLKGAYENYNNILQYDPVNEEALNEMNQIRELLNARSRKIYREAIISESLSLFDDAKEKFQEVQQISPSDSDYYKKATEKLKEYLE